MMAALALQLALALDPVAGDLVHYTFPGTADAQCLRVQGTFVGADGHQWAWLTGATDPRRVLRVPVADLRTGCTPQ